MVARMLQECTSSLEIGGQDKEELLFSLHKNGVRLNRYAHILFDDPALTTSKSTRWVLVRDVTVAELGLVNPTSAALFDRARSVGLELCPLELAPRLRLQFLEQTEGPYLTIASRKLRDDEAYPNGFYLRKIDGELWLRGYTATSEYRWEPSSRFVFLVH